MWSKDNCLFEGVTDLERLLGHLEPTICGLTLDTAHAVKAEIEEIAALVPRFRKHLNNVHLKDFSEDGVFCPLGHGIIDLDAVLQALRDIEYDEWLMSTMNGSSSTRRAAPSTRKPRFGSPWNS